MCLEKYGRHNMLREIKNIMRSVKDEKCVYFNLILHIYICRKMKLLQTPIGWSGA